jgi:hypothetical protein
VPLTYRDRGNSGTRLEIVSGTVVIGSFWKDVLSVSAGNSERWSWTFYMDAFIEERLDNFSKHGSAGSREIAQADIERNWKTWLAAAELTEAKVRRKPISALEIRRGARAYPQ